MSESEIAAINAKYDKLKEEIEAREITEEADLIEFIKEMQVHLMVIQPIH